MIFHDHIGINVHPFLRLQELPGREEHVDQRRAAEEWQPVDHRASEEVGGLVFVNPVAASGHNFSGRRASLRHSHAERGNENLD